MIPQVVVLPAWLAAQLPSLAAVICLLLLVTSAAAIRQLRRAAAGAPERRPERLPPPTSAPGPGSGGPSVRRQRLAERLPRVRPAHADLFDVPVLVAFGAPTAEIMALLPDARPRLTVDGDPALPLGDGYVSMCAGGAVISFADGLLGAPGWEKRLVDLIGELRAARRDRPLDGLVVVVGADLLSGDGRLGYDGLAALGGRLNQAIQIAQQASGWRVPVQLTLNCCDVLPGFAATVDLLSPPLRDAPFGWAPPPWPGRSFTAGWVGQSANSLAAEITALQARLPPTEGVAGSDDATQLPAALQALGGPLAILLGNMLGTAVDQATLMFRGFYLTGRHGPRLPNETTGLDVFARRLFAERFFPEHVLARPSSATVARRKRQIRVAQMAMAATMLLAATSFWMLSRRAAGVETIDRMVLALAPALKPLSAAGPDGTEAVLRAITPLALNGLETGWAPLSFLTGADGAVEAVIRAGYETGVLPPIHARLSGAIPELLNATATGAPAASCSAGDATAADAAALAPFADRLTQYGRQVAAYQELPGDPDLTRFGSLIRFALSLDPPAGFAGTSGLYRAALAGAAGPVLDTRSMRKTVDGLVQAQFGRGLSGAYPGSPVARAVAEVAANAGRIGLEGSSVQSVRALAGALHAVEAQAPLPENLWVAGVGGASAVDDFLGKLAPVTSGSVASGTVALIDADRASAMRAEATACRQQTAAQLRAATVFGGTPVLTVKVVVPGLTAALAAVTPVLDQFLAQPLMTMTLPPPGPRPPPADAQLLWDTTQLQAAQAATAGYLAFVAKDLPATLPPDLTLQLQAAAGVRLDQLTAATIAGARQAGADRRAGAGGTSTAALRDAIARFAGAAPILTNLRASLNQAGRVATAAELDGILFDQAIGLLRQVDGVLNGADPYQLSDPSLAFWTGAPPLAAPAFGAATQADLVGSLPVRREYVAALSADYAAPLVAYMQQSGALPTVASTALLTRWQQIATQLGRFKNGDTTGSVSRLEQFISTGMDQITLADCQQATSAAGSGTDWFAQMQLRIASAVARRCSSVSTANARSEYTDLSAAFNRDLAGRFPFGAPDAPDADAGAVKAFFNRFGGDLPALRARVAAIPAHARAGAPQFLDALQAAQAALAPMLQDPAPDAVLTYEVTPTFRSNPGRDPGADQLAEQVLSFGPAALSSFGPGKSLVWSSGQAAGIELRWAANVPNAPVAGPAGSQPAVDGLVARYRYDGTWALLRLLAQARPGPAALAQLQDQRPEPVGYTVALTRNPQAVAGGDAGLVAAQVYLRMALTGIVKVPQQPDKRVAVTLPTFPRAAPIVGVR